MRPSGDSRLSVLLVSMPFAARDRPSLGLSSLKARLSQRDVACDVAYLDLAFARRLGEEDYDAILDGLPFAALAGEWVFTECLYGSCAPSPGAYVDDVLRGEWKLDADRAEPLLRARDRAPVHRGLAECGLLGEL